MKKLFGDSVVSKLRVLPPFVWGLFVYVSFFLAGAYEYVLTGAQAGEYVAQAYAQMGYPSTFNTVTIGVFAAIFSPLFSYVIFEFIIAVIFNSVAGRYRCQINKADFKFRIRYLVLIINTIIGILSIGYFFTQKVNGVLTPKFNLFTELSSAETFENAYYSIQSAVLPFAVTAGFCLWFFEDFRKRFVPSRNQAPLFSMFAMIFIGIYVAIFLIGVLQTFLLYSNVSFTKTDILSYSLEGGVLALAIIGYFVYYLKLKKNEKDDGNNNFTFRVVETEEQPSEKIFDDFNF